MQIPLQLPPQLEDAPAWIQWLQTSGLGNLIRSGKWPYPSIEIVHLVGLILVFGSVLVVNLRIFGHVLRSTPVAEAARELAPVTRTGLGLQVLSGPLMFITSAVRFYGNVQFRVKLVLLFAALVYHFAVHRPLTFQAGAPIAKLRKSAAFSLVMWSAVVLAGLSIELLN